jgi:GNAT superfamily N-acetyltransferase
MNAATPVDVALARRIEEASLNAWPAMQQIFLDGWVLRFSRGFTKRANSIVPLYPPMQSTETLLQKIRYCENLYAREQLQTVFRLTSINEPAPSLSRASDPSSSETLDGVLSSREYQLDEISLVLTAAITATPTENQIELLPLDHWLNVYCDLTGMTQPARSLHSVILKSIQGECAFAILRSGNEPVAIGLAIVERELVGLFDIYTADKRRGAGFGKCLVANLLNWAAQAGAQRAYLQMVGSNEPAAALYAALGFEEIYRYWYRIAR